MKKLFSLLFISLFLISLVGAAQLNVPYDITIGCSEVNCSQTWNITLLNPNSSINIDNQLLGVQDSYLNYTFTPTTQGEYTIYLLSDEGEYFQDTLDVTYIGKSLSEGQSILYVGLLGILVLLIMATFFGIGMLPDKNTRDEEGKIISISYLKYFRSILWFVEWLLLIAILFISSNIAQVYLPGALVAGVFFKLFYICLALTPLIITLWIIWLLVSAFQDKQFQRLLNRGFFPQGNL